MKRRGCLGILKQSLIGSLRQANKGDTYSVSFFPGRTPPRVVRPLPLQFRRILVDEGRPPLAEQLAVVLVVLL